MIPLREYLSPAISLREAADVSVTVRKAEGRIGVDDLLNRDRAGKMIGDGSAVGASANVVVASCLRSPQGKILHEIHG